MTHTPERILRNTGIMIGALSLQKIIALLYFALVARGFGAAVTGEFFFATSLGMLMTVLLDSGQSALLIQESARDMERARNDFRAMLAVKIVGAGSIAIVGGAALAFFTPNPLLRSFLVFIFFSSLCEAFHGSLYGVLRAHQLHSIEGIAGVVGQIITLAVGALAWKAILPMSMLIGAYLVGNFFHVVLSGSIVWYRFGFSFVPDFSPKALRHWLQRALPFAIAAYFTKVGTYTDSVLLRTFGGATALGLYSVPFKTSFSWSFVPQGFIATLFPAMSFFAAGDKPKLARALHRGLELLLFLAAPLAFGIAATAPTFIPRIFGAQYLSSTAYSQAYAFLIFPLFLQYPLGSLFNASDRAAVYTRILGLSMLANVFANVLLIPRLGVWGAVVSALFSHTLLVVLGVRKAREVVEFQWRRLGNCAVRIFTSALLMFGAVRMVASVGLVSEIAVGFVVYAVVSWFLRVWSSADLDRLWRFRYGKNITGDNGIPAE